MTLPSASFYDTLAMFASAFTTPTYNNFVTIAIGWLFARDRHTVSQALRVGLALGFSKHHSVLYRLLRGSAFPGEVVGFVPGISRPSGGKCLVPSSAGSVPGVA